MIITAYNHEPDELEKTYLTSAISSGVTALTVKNNDLFAANNRIMIGEMGREKTEVVTVSATSGGTSVTTGATVFSHEADDPIYVLRFDQVRFYRSTTGSTGTYTLLATVDMDVDNAGLFTTHDDTTGLSTYYYKVAFYNSASTLESALSDPVLGTGYTRNSVGFLVDEILNEINDPTEALTSRKEILGWFNECSDDLTTRARKPYDFLLTRTTFTRTANTNTVDFPTDANGNQSMLKFDHLDLNFVESPNTDQMYTIQVVPLDEFRNRFSDLTVDATTVDDQVQFMAIDTAVKKFRFWPPFQTTSAGVFYLYYYKYFTQLDSEGDTFETPNPRAYKLFALAKFYRKRASQDGAFLQLSDRYFADYSQEVSKFKRADIKDAGSPRGFRFNPQTFRGNRRF